MVLYGQKKIGNNIKTPGNLIIQSMNEKLLGTTLTLLGSFVISAPQLIPSISEFNKSFRGLGLTICGVGLGFYISAHIKMRKVGVLLNENGIGVKVKL